MLSEILMRLMIVGHVAAAGAGNSSSAGAAAPKCEWPIHYGLIITKGVYTKQSELGDAASCCALAGTYRGLRGWTWSPPSHTELAAPLTPPPLARVGAGPMPPVVYDNTLYHVGPSNPPDFPSGGEITLQGKVTENGGMVAVHSLNGSFVDTHIQFSAAWSPSPRSDPFWFMNLTMHTKAGTHVGWATSMSNAAGSPAMTLEWYTSAHSMAHVAAYLSLGPNPPPPIGKCQFYESVLETRQTSDKRWASGGPAPFPPTDWST